jgi:hypothetical protein
MKFIFKWLFRLFLLCVVLVVVFLLSLDPVLRLVAQHNIRAQTGMDAQIGRFHLGLLDPVITIENLRLYNPPSFGGTPFLNIPEIHLEYDRTALKRDSKLHLTLVRFNLSELVIVRNEAGKTNLFELGVALPSKESTGAAPLQEFKRKTGLEFEQIDALNVSIGTLKYMDLKEPSHNREQKVGIHDMVIKNVKMPADLAGLVLLVALRSDNFFTPFAVPAVK